MQPKRSRKRGIKMTSNTTKKRHQIHCWLPGGHWRLLALVGLFFCVLAQAAPINYQGRLDADGEPFSGSANLSFLLFNAESGGQVVAGPVSLNNWPVVNGLFQVELDFGPNAFSGSAERYLEITVNGLALSPRQRVTAAPMAITTLPGAIGTDQINPAQVQRRIGSSCPEGQFIRSVNQNGTPVCASAAGSGGTVTSVATGAGLTGGPITATGTISIAPGGVGTTQINSAQVQRRVSGDCPAGQYMRRVNEDGTVLCQAEIVPAPAWLLGGNDGTDQETHFIGTVDDQALEFRTRNARTLRLVPSSILFEGLPVSNNVIAGSRVNFIANDAIGAVVAGGGSPQGFEFNERPGGANRARASFSTISGGINNEVALAGQLGTIGGGQNNRASGVATTVGGGLSNTVGSSAEWGTIGGGLDNQVIAQGSTVGGGQNNRVAGSLFPGFATIGGGKDNVVSRFAGTVGGGELNTVSNVYGTVAGGLENTASGSRSAVSGGHQNCAGGDYSWAGGRRAKVRVSNQAVGLGSGCEGVPGSGTVFGDLGTFIWADSQDEDFMSSGPDQFLVRAAGGVGFGRTPSDYFVIDSGRELQDDDYSFGTGALRVLMNDPNGSVVTMFRIMGNGGLAVGNSFNSSGVPERGMRVQGRVALQSLGSGGSTTLCRNGDNEVATCGSSVRYKFDIEDLDNPQALLFALRPVRYQWLDGSGEDIGLVAEEVAQAVPELAVYMDGQVEGVKYDRLGVLLLAVVQQQSEEIAELRRRSERAAALAEQNSQLEARLAALEALLLGDQALAGAQ
ncbi:MAG: tail fiber domain-containing protein [Wenzhouxiangella sp.]